MAGISGDMRQVDSVIRLHLQSEVALINSVAEYIIGAGGKRLRPATLLVVAQALGSQVAFRHEMAAVIEFIHTATLLHDDVVDASELRRGRPTANAIFGNPASVLVGDFLYSRAFQMMVKVGQARILQILADATNTIAEGEVLQLMNCHDPEVSEARYLQVIRYKTARLFEASAQLAALLAHAESTVEQACAAYGRHLGTAFQIIDDVLDYSGDAQEIGKNVGDDLREGKPTLPLIWLSTHGTPQHRALVRRAITVGDVPVNEITEALHHSGALLYARKCAQTEALLAARTLQELPLAQDQAQQTAREVLLDLCAFAVSREQ